MIKNLNIEQKRELLTKLKEGTITKEDLKKGHVITLLTEPKPIIFIAVSWASKDFKVNGKLCDKNTFEALCDAAKMFLSQEDYVIVTAPNVIGSRIPTASSEDEVIL